MWGFARQLVLHSIIAAILVIGGVYFVVGHHPYWLIGCLVLASVLISRSLFGLLTRDERGYTGLFIESLLVRLRLPPVNLQSIDDYVQRERNKLLAIRVGGFAVILTIGIYFFSRSSDFMFFMLILMLVIYSLYELISLRMRLGERVWEVECPECKNYIPLHLWICPACGQAYSSRHMLEGCLECGTRYGSGERDIHAQSCKPPCEYELSFFSPYEFKNWSVLATGEDSRSTVYLVERFRFIKLIAAGFYVWAVFNLLFGAYTCIFLGEYREINHNTVQWSLGVGSALLLIEGWLLPKFLKFAGFPPLMTINNMKKKPVMGEEESYITEGLENETQI